MINMDVQTALQGIKKGQIKRLGYVAGIKRMQGDIYEELRTTVFQQLEKLLRTAHTYRVHGRRTTLSADDVNHALKFLGLKAVYGGEEATVTQVVSYEKQLKKGGHSKNTEDIGEDEEAPKKKVKFSSGIRYLRRVRYYQKQHDVVFIAKSPFHKLVRAVSTELDVADGRTAKYAKGAFLILQLYIENYLVELLEMVNLVCINAGRETIYPKDVSLVRRIRGERN
jgi:histone H3/H4